MRDTRLYNRPAKSESADLACPRQRSQRKPVKRALGFSGPQGLFAASYP
jgi:hypothetical protein